MIAIVFLMLMVPLLLYGLSPDWLRPWIAYSFAVIIVLYVLWFIRSLIRARAGERTRASRGAYLWAPGSAAVEYASRLGIHLSTSGWRVLHANVPDADSVMLQLQLDRVHLAVLCRRPGVAFHPLDVDRLVDTGCPQRLLISDPALGHNDTHQGYDVLADLTQSMGVEAP